MIEIYEGDHLRIEKQDGVSPVSTFSEVQSQATLNAAEMLETAFTYMEPGYRIAVTSEHGECRICGAETEFKNRHICPYCWNQFESRIFSALKEKCDGDILA